MTDWPTLPDEADEIPDELALRVGRALLCDRLLTRRYFRALAAGGKHSQAALDLATPCDAAEYAYIACLEMALEVLDDGT